MFSRCAVFVDFVAFCVLTGQNLSPRSSSISSTLCCEYLRGCRFVPVLVVGVLHVEDVDGEHVFAALPHLFLPVYLALRPRAAYKYHLYSCSDACDACSAV